MTDREYLERLFDLTTRLTNAVEQNGYRSDAYNAVLKEIAECGSKFNRRRCRRSWISTAVLIFLLFILAWLIFECLSLL